MYLGRQSVAGAEEYVPADLAWPGGSESLSLWKQKRLHRSGIPTVGKGKSHASERGPGDVTSSLAQFQNTMDTGNKQKGFPVRLSFLRCLKVKCLWTPKGAGLRGAEWDSE